MPSPVLYGENSMRLIKDQLAEAQADADRRLLLMQKQDKKIKVCQFCYRHLKWSKDIQRMVGHAEDCEWGKELADAR